MPERSDVYAAIDGERAYQGTLGPTRTDGEERSVGDYLVMLGTYYRRATEGWTNSAGTEIALDNMRKIAAIAVRCMEEHGAPRRRGF